MNTTLLFVLMAFVLLVVFAMLAARRTQRWRDVDHAVAGIQSLDIEAFRNLVDPEEEAFLRARLPARQFRRVQRQRTRAALAYVQALSQASQQLARFGGTAQRSSDPVLAESGRQIANSANRLRLQALQTSVRLGWSTAFPGFGPRSLPSLVEQYDRATHLLENHIGLTRSRSGVA